MKIKLSEVKHFQKIAGLLKEEDLRDDVLADEVYNEFVNSQYGKKVWNMAHAQYPKCDEGGHDTDNAMDYILEKMRELYMGEVDVQGLEPFKIFYDEEWNTEVADAISEAIYAGLT